jgi:hypothetical protein
MPIDNIANSKLFDPNNGIQATGSNYRSVYDFTNQYLPDAMPDLVNIFNPQSITGFLDTMGYEEELQSDLAIWGEYGRRHKLHTGVTRSANVFTSTAHSVRVQDKILVYASGAAGKQIGLVTATTADTFTAVYQGGAAWTVGIADLFVRVIGGEFRKGTDGKAQALTREFTRYSVSPVIIKDQFSVDGSDIPNITWLYDSEGNPYWYMEDEVESFKRFLDNIEFQMLEDTVVDAGATGLSTYKGTQGLFSSVRSRGNTFTGEMSSIADIDGVVERLDKVNGEIYNGLYLTTSHILNIDTALAGELGYDAATVNYGVYGMDKQRVLDLGFKGFRRGTYEFHYSGWNILKDPTALNPDNFNAADRIHGLMVPMGMTSEAGAIMSGFDKMMPERIQYLTQMYKAKAGYSRKLKTSYAGGTMVPDNTSTTDRYEIHWLTERCLRAVGMIKWMIFQGA